MHWSSRLIKEKLWKGHVFVIDVNGSKRVAGTWKTMKEVAQEVIEPMKMLKKYGIWCIQVDVKVLELTLSN
jgi:hypothetical protein